LQHSIEVNLEKRHAMEAPEFTLTQDWSYSALDFIPFPFHLVSSCQWITHNLESVSFPIPLNSCLGSHACDWIQRTFEMITWLFADECWPADSPNPSSKGLKVTPFYFSPSLLYFINTH
jgi:hypothetical protein